MVPRPVAAPLWTVGARSHHGESPLAPAACLGAVLTAVNPCGEYPGVGSSDYTHVSRRSSMATRTKRAPKKPARRRSHEEGPAHPRWLSVDHPLPPGSGKRPRSRLLYEGIRGQGEGPHGWRRWPIMHAEDEVFNTRVMLSRRVPERARSRQSRSRAVPVGLFVYTRDVDGAIARAVGRGRDGDDADPGYVLGRSLRDHPRPFRARLAARDPQGGRGRPRNAATFPGHAGQQKG